RPRQKQKKGEIKRQKERSNHHSKSRLSCPSVNLNLASACCGNAAGASSWPLFWRFPPCRALVDAVHLRKCSPRGDRFGGHSQLSQNFANIAHHLTAPG